jgi:lipopolysaccharide transport system ATP-binding protein
MSRLAVRAASLSKWYRRGRVRVSGTRRPTVAEAIMGAVRAPLMNLRALRSLASFDIGDEPITWALRDVSFELNQGEVLGLVGRNGAGKSTLLKILSRITEPSSGWAEVNGSVGSLLEVGTGFHPDLTGRQNVFLNGSILGMTRRDIALQFDKIVDFAEVGAFIDTPVKRYSSGMQVRLAFAVAAHLQPDIMIVDEVLAVGDAEFQRKCLAKMDAVATGGRTIIFVSHNIDAVQRLCTRCMLLDEGRVIADGPTSEVTRQYHSDSLRRSVVALPATWIDLTIAPREGSGEVTFESLRYSSESAASACFPYAGGPVEFALSVRSDRPRRLDSLAVTFYDESGTKLVNADTAELGSSLQLQQGRNTLSLRIKELHLRPGNYFVGLWAADSTCKPYDHVPRALFVEVVDVRPRGFGRRTEGLVNCEFEVRDVTTGVVV